MLVRRVFFYLLSFALCLNSNSICHFIVLHNILVDLLQPINFYLFENIAVSQSARLLNYYRVRLIHRFIQLNRFGIFITSLDHGPCLLGVLGVLLGIYPFCRLLFFGGSSFFSRPFANIFVNIHLPLYSICFMPSLTTFFGICFFTPSRLFNGAHPADSPNPPSVAD